MLLNNLSSHIHSLWRKAYERKRPVTEQILDNLRRYCNEYDPQKLAEINKLGGSKVYIHLTETKCNAAHAWISDIFRSVDRFWDIIPTPEPTLGVETELSVIQSITRELVAALQKQGLTPEEIISRLEELKPELTKKVNKKIYEKASEYCEIISQRLDDQLHEGGFYRILRDLLFDFVVMKNCFLKVVPRRNKYVDHYNKVQETVSWVFEQRSPFRIFPSNDHPDISRNSFVIDIVSYTPYELSQFIGMEGINDDSIKRILDKHSSGGYRDWLVKAIDEQQSLILDRTKSDDQEAFIDIIEFWGNIQGDLLIEWGMENLEPYKFYPVSVWVIGDEVPLAIMNPDPMGYKPFFSAGYVGNNMSVWKKGLPELLKDLQDICNALARAIVNNSALSSAPMMELDRDRFPEGVDTYIYPMKKFVATGGQMSESPAIRFYQPSMVAYELTRVFDYFSKLADQYSIPSYAHGDFNIGGAGNTVGGLSMLMSSATKVIKNAVANFDDLVVKMLEFLYNKIRIEDNSISKIGDVRIVAKATAYIMQEEQQAVRRQEFLQATLNPLDSQIIGLSGRKELLRQVAKNLKLTNIDKIFQDYDRIDEIILQGTQQPVLGAGVVPPKKSTPLDAGGNKIQGEDTRLIDQSEVEPKRGGE